MIFTRSNLYGIDAKIKMIQQHIDNKLNHLGWKDVYVYGRGHDILKNGNKILAFYETGIDYELKLLDDNKNAIVGFKVLERPISNNILLASVDIIFTINLEKIYGINDYKDEKCLIDVYKIISNCGYISDITNIKTGIEQVFSGYYTENIKHLDMSPFCVFSITIDISYTDKLC